MLPDSWRKLGAGCAEWGVVQVSLRMKMVMMVIMVMLVMMVMMVMLVMLVMMVMLEMMTIKVRNLFKSVSG